MTRSSGHLWARSGPKVSPTFPRLAMQVRVNRWNQQRRLTLKFHTFPWYRWMRCTGPGVFLGEGEEQQHIFYTSRHVRPAVGPCGVQVIACGCRNRMVEMAMLSSLRDRVVFRCRKGGVVWNGILVLVSYTDGCFLDPGPSCSCVDAGFCFQWWLDRFSSCRWSCLFIIYQCAVFLPFWLIWVPVVL